MGILVQEVRFNDETCDCLPSHDPANPHWINCDQDEIDYFEVFFLFNNTPAIDQFATKVYGDPGRWATIVGNAKFLPNIPGNFDKLKALNDEVLDVGAGKWHPPSMVVDPITGDVIGSTNEVMPGADDDWSPPNPDALGAGVSQDPPAGWADGWGGAAINVPQHGLTIAWNCCPPTSVLPIATGTTAILVYE